MNDTNLTPIQQLIAKLPPQFQSWAETYIQFIANNTFEQITAWINLIMLGDWQAAYEQVIANMTTEQLGQELDRINESFRLQNITNVAQMVTQRAMIQNLLSILIAVAQVAIGL